MLSRIEQHFWHLSPYGLLALPLSGAFSLFPRDEEPRVAHDFRTCKPDMTNSFRSNWAVFDMLSIISF
jgi:hypothetical protein